MISVSKASEYLSNVVADYLSFRFFKKLIVFDLRAYQSHLTLIREDDESIKFKNATHLIKIILDIGVKIRKLEIITDKRIVDDEKEYILMRIKQQFLESLVELHVTGLDAFIEGIEKPFSKVETFSWLHLLHADRNVNLDKYKLNKIFPALRSLELTIPPTANHTSLSIPQMEEFEVIYGFDQEIIDFLKANLQIKRLKLIFTNPKELKFVADAMPNLEVLKIRAFDELMEFLDQNYSYNFERLKCVEFSCRWPGEIKFSNRLEEFTSSEFPTKEYIQFLANNPNLKKLRIIQFTRIEQIQELISANLSVTKMHLGINEEVKPENVIQLIESCQQLNEFIFQVAEKLYDGNKTYDEWDQEQTLIKHFTDWTLNKDRWLYSFTKYKKESE